MGHSEPSGRQSHRIRSDPYKARLSNVFIEFMARSGESGHQSPYAGSLWFHNTNSISLTREQHCNTN